MPKTHPIARRAAFLLAVTVALVVSLPTSSALPDRESLGEVLGMVEDLGAVQCPAECGPRVPDVDAQRSVNTGPRCVAARVCASASLYVEVHTAPDPRGGEQMMMATGSWGSSPCIPTAEVPCGGDDVGVYVGPPPQCGAGCEPGEWLAWVNRIIRNIDPPVVVIVTDSASR